MGECLLPLFPLNVVLFPRTNLPLHIFEERYKQMIAECLESRSEFGVVLAREKSVENTGCTASITEVVKRYDDGRMDIMVRGARRFEILLLDQEMAYLRGTAQFFDDDAAAALPPGDPRRSKAVELFGQLREMLELEENEAEKGNMEVSDSQLSYQIIARLPADLEFKQTLLLLRSEAERLTRVIPYLQKLLVQIALAIKARASASGNGKGR